jgi:hypothetical protein
MLYLIVTTSIIDKHMNTSEDHRKNRYMECIQYLIDLLEEDSSVKLIVVENNGPRQTYLDNLKCDILYTNNNNYKFAHKGVNELSDIKDVIEHYHIKEDDMIIKLTGRYKMLDMSFIQLVKDKSKEYDAFIKFFNVCELKYMYDDCVLGLFAMKCKYIKDFEYDCIKSPECEMAEYARENIHKLMEIDQLNLECCFADDLRRLVV